MPCCISAFDLDKKGKKRLKLCDFCYMDIWNSYGITSTLFALASVWKMEDWHSLWE